MVCDQNHVIIGCSQPNDVDLESPYFALFVENNHLPKTVATKQAVDLHLLVATRATNRGVSSNADAKRDVVLLEPDDPFSADEFPVSCDTIDLEHRKDVEETFHQLDTFIRVGAATLVQKGPKQRDANAFVSNAKNQEVDVLCAELPVGTVNTESPPLTNRHESNDGFGEVVEVKEVVRQKALYPLIMG
jgi:hypothetical protein